MTRYPHTLRISRPVVHDDGMGGRTASGEEVVFSAPVDAQEPERLHRLSEGTVREEGEIHAYVRPMDRAAVAYLRPGDAGTLRIDERTTVPVVVARTHPLVCKITLRYA